MNIKNDKLYYYIYKITNKINNKFYYGMHCTNNLEDDYMGSGLVLNRAIEKYGIVNFEKEILQFYSNIEQLVQAEKEILTEELIKNPMCYNLNKGGKGSFYYINNSTYSEIYKEKGKKTKKKFYKTQEGLACRKRTGEKVSKYAKNNPLIIKEKNQRAKVTRSRMKKEISEKITKGLNNFYNSEKGKLEKINKSINSKIFWNSNQGIQLKSIFSEKNKGFSNPEFVKLVKPKFDHLYDSVIQYACLSNLPDRDIDQLLNINLKHALHYYEFCGWLANVQSIITKSPDITSSSVIKTSGDIIKNYDCFKKQNYKFLITEYIDYFNRNVDLLFDNNYSDTLIVKESGNNLVQSTIKYLEYLGCIHIQEKKKVNIRKYRPNSPRKFGTKTIINFNINFKQDYILINRGVLENEFKISIDENERCISVVRS